MNGIILFDICSAYPKSPFAKEVNRKRLEEINIKYQQLKSKNIDYFFRTSNANYLSRNKLVKELKENGDKLFNLLALEKTDSKINYLVDINSDIQYREKEVFYAEGNATINFFDAILKGDLIKYDLENKLLTVFGNVIFKKGEQYFEASKLYFDLKNDTGYIEDIYGVLNNKTFSEDFKFEINKNNGKLLDQNNQLGQQTNSFNFPKGLENDLKDSKTFKVKSTDLNNFTIRKLRYKADKLTYNSRTLESKKIFFTNDIYNDPQFIFLSKNFSAEIVDEKLRLLSRNSWIKLDNKLNIPIGRNSFLEGESSLNFGFGADYNDKDGYYLYRGFYPGKLFKDFSFQYTPYFLIQRALKGSTNSFTAKNSSVFSENVEISSAENPANYSISNNIIVESASRHPFQWTRVNLTTSFHVSGNYEVIASNVMDEAGNLSSGAQGSYSVLGLEENSNPLVTLYPNPSSGTLFIEGLERIEAIEIVDILGKTLYQNRTSEAKFELNLKLKEGLYFLKHNNSKTPFIIK